jgi:hypothetical protein
VTALAVEGGLVIDEMQPRTAEDAPHYRAVPVRIVGKGAYPACARFLHRLRTEFPDTGVRSFEAAHGGPDPEAPDVTFDLELLWFTARTGGVTRGPQGTLWHARGLPLGASTRGPAGAAASPGSGARPSLTDLPSTRRTAHPPARAVAFRAAGPTTTSPGTGVRNRRKRV